MAFEIACSRTRESIASRFRAGDSVAELAHDYDQPTEAIEAAIREGMVADDRVRDLQRELAAANSEILRLEKRLWDMPGGALATMLDDQRDTDASELAPEPMGGEF
jgi:hypothetical protein